MEEELQLCAQLSVCHALYLVIGRLLLDHLNVELHVKSQRLLDWLASATHWKLHPKLLESLAIEFRDGCKTNLLWALAEHVAAARGVHHAIQAVGRSGVVLLGACVEHAKQIIFLVLIANQAHAAKQVALSAVILSNIAASSSKKVHLEQITSATHYILRLNLRLPHFEQIVDSSSLVALGSNLLFCILKQLVLICGCLKPSFVRVILFLGGNTLLQGLVFQEFLRRPAVNNRQSVKLQEQALSLLALLVLKELGHVFVISCHRTADDLLGDSHIAAHELVVEHDSLSEVGVGADLKDMFEDFGQNDLHLGGSLEEQFG